MFTRLRALFAQKTVNTTKEIWEGLEKKPYTECRRC